MPIRTGRGWDHDATWTAVVGAAGAHCQCPGGHPKHKPDEPCPRETLTGELVAAPVDPAVAPESAWRVPAAELAAWCPPCLDAMRAAARAAARRRPAPVEPDLFSTAGGDQ